MFPKSTLLIQKAEIDFAFAEGKPAPFRKDRPMQQLAGDLDVFGDGIEVRVGAPDGPLLTQMLDEEALQERREGPVRGEVSHVPPADCETPI